MLRRISALAAAIVILFSGNVSASLKDTECKAQAGLLEAVGVLQDSEKLSEKQKVTRKEFAEMLVKAAGVLSIDQETEFTDFKAKGAIANAVNLGIISGYSDGSFKPGNIITIAEAVKMTVEALSLDILQSNLEYPLSYMQIASERKLLKNVSSCIDNDMSASDAVHLLYNMLNTAVPTPDSSLNKIVFDEDVTLLKERFGIVKSKGVVTGNEDTRLTSTEGAKNGYVEINNTIYGTGETDAYDFLGYLVDYYYTEKEYELVYITYADKVRDIVIYSDEIEEFKNHTYYYFNDEGSTKYSKAVMDDNVNVIYNGKALTDIINDEIYIPEYGYVVMVDNDNDSIYETVFIYDVTVIVFNMLNSDEHILYGKYTPDKFFVVNTEDNDQNITITDSFGKAMSAEDFKNGDILEIAQSKDVQITDITVYRKSISATVQSVSANEEGRYIIGDGRRYNIEKSFDKYMQENGISFQMGKEYTFYLDGRDRIASYSAAEEKGEYGYLFDVKLDDYDDEIFYLKILTESGNIETITSAKKVNIDGMKMKAQEAYVLLDDILNSGTAPTIIWYETNIDGELRLVDTPVKGAKEGSNSLHTKGKTNSENYNNGAKTIAGKINFNDESVVFMVPYDTSSRNKNDYSVGKPADVFVHYSPYTVTGYSRDRKSPYSDAILYVGKAEESIASKSDLLLVQSISECLNAEDEVTNEITVLTIDGEKQYITENIEVLNKASTYSGTGSVSVKSGDVIRLAQNSRGEVSVVQVIYSPSSDKLYLTRNPESSNIPYPFQDYDNLYDYYNIKSDFNKVCRITMGNVFYKSDAYLRIVNPIFDLTDVQLIRHIENGNIAIENYNAVNIFKYNENGKVPYRTADISEIYDYSTTKRASKVLIRTNDAVTKIIVIY